ncbi:c-type cytochrome biogenesis protein CcmI [Rubellimicrobium sp. CFH 75288]|uniref:c-type cytochrome biogenesis protein CcmI n=1 Tax=Rubellimicrobium sp. CFH 75288 TaxID=2697034 RepID=UPI001412471A|nr:c-type cytochrome biogenesis protein CcmI [Rubellimicrobium sp. CFH 75288]NAZ36384.1 c-type cytochrome biogenesis protein CcmI [Rubellimicrobium sp. CFH 75288]
MALFWFLAAGLALVVAALLARPILVRERAAYEAPEAEAAIYRDQLREVERDVARGVLDPAEAERARTEIARRLLAADRARRGMAGVGFAPRPLARLAVASAALLVVGGGLGLYAALGWPALPDAPRAERLAQAEALRAARPSQEEAEEQALALMPPPEPGDLPQDYLAMVEQLRQIVPDRPDDLQGWTLLAQHEARLGRYADAARAQERVILLKGDRATTADWLDLADRMVAAAGGLVTQETEAVLARIEEREPLNPGLLYYRGLLEAQTGRPDRAFPLWRRVIEDGPDSLHRRLALTGMEEVAWLAGQDWTPPPAPAIPGPSAEDMDAAATMDPAARAAMVRGMVESMESRLREEGGSAEEWAQLVNALAVLGERAAAWEALEDARRTFRDDERALSVLAAVARQAGVEAPAGAGPAPGGEAPPAFVGPPPPPAAGPAP